MWRDSREIEGKPDVFARYANRVHPRSLLSRLGLRFLQGAALRTGDLVRGKDLAEIEQTLDEKRATDELPFMPEMELFCGRVYRVHRRVDKINDMRNKTGLRHVREAVTLTDIRCSGAQHGGCQAECQIIWKEAWLEKVPRREHEAESTPSDIMPESQPHGPVSGDDDTTYFCQMTRLWEASDKMPAFDFRQDLRSVFSGNIGFVPFLLAMLTRLFNIVQSWRGGNHYPYMPPVADAGRTPGCDLGLEAGDRVTIRSKQAIAGTLVSGRNRGLWYDRDMIRFSNQPAIVRKRVSRVIDERTGRMVVFKMPCIALEGIVGTGEFLRFCPQHEYIFWREIWLQPAVEGRAASNTVLTAST